jgi:hypothetical protein
MADSPSTPSDETPLYEGEERVDTVTAGDTRLVVTTHRLLVRPEGDPSGRRAVDRANLGAIQVQARSTRGYIWSGLQWGLLGVFLLGAWQVVPFGSLVRRVEQPDGAGFGGLFRAARTLVDLFAFLDEAFLFAGVFALAWSGVRFAQYVRSRERTLEIAVVGADPVRLPVPETDAAVERLRELLAPESDSER